MSRRYSPDEKRQALERLAANHHNYRLTSAETGIPMRTLRNWNGDPQTGEPDPNNSAEVMRYLRANLVNHIKNLADSLEKGIDDVPLNQRVTALAQLIDRLLKLADKLPSEPKKEQVIRVEYVNPDGTIGDAPPWAEADTEL